MEPIFHNVPDRGRMSSDDLPVMTWECFAAFAGNISNFPE